MQLASSQAILEDNSGVEVLKRGGLKVLRAQVTRTSRLVGQTAANVRFRENYKAAIVAVQQGGKNATQPLSSITFGAGDILVLQVSDDCPLLAPSVASTSGKSLFSSMSVKSKFPVPQAMPDNVLDQKYSANQNSEYDVSNANSTPLVLYHNSAKTILKTNPFGIDTIASNDSEFNEFRSYLNGADLPPSHHKSVRIEETPTPLNDEAAEAVRRDLTVLSTGIDGSSSTPKSKEFLVAMRISPKSTLSGKNIEKNGITRVPGVYVVGIERPKNQLYNSEGNAFNTIDPDQPLQDGDILWFAGDASSVGDLRKIPGLESPEEGEIKQMNENVHDRVLVQAVIARSAPLVGKTVREVSFRTKYGAAVISVHREGHRIHEHPGNIKLHAGDVLLLEAGPTFFKKSANIDHSFALLAEVKDSAPPRMKYLIPAIILMVAMLVVSGLDFNENVSLLICATFAGVVMVAMGLLSCQEARDSIDWALYVAIACSFGISQALTNSGLAAVCANFLITVGEGSGLGGMSCHF